jgi:hypothetical protein
LGRTPDPNGLAHYVEALHNGAPFSHLISEVENSPEAGRHRQLLEDERAYCVHAVYREYLGRTPDPNGLAHYVEALRNGAPFSHLIREVENSLEAEQRRQLLEAQRAYCVHSIYQQRLGRVADPEGLQHYVSALRNGMSIRYLIEEIDNSPEAERYRRRPTDQDDPSDWEFILGIFQTGKSSPEARVQKASHVAFEIDPSCIQHIMPANPTDRFEGIDFSASGNIIAVATLDTDKVLLFRRKPDGRFEDSPFRTIGQLDQPHDVSFSQSEGMELLAVAQRTGAVAMYNRNGPDESYDPIFEIKGPQAKLAYTDAVSFVPPQNDYLAACNLNRSTVLFFRRSSLSSASFEDAPEFELKLPKSFNPDGLAFSRCGRWLATANLGNQSVSVFERCARIVSGDKPFYGPKPVTIIEDPTLRYPHSLAFTRTNHLIVTNSGARYFNVYEPRQHDSGMQWSQSPVARVIAQDDEAFQAANTASKLEGGPKGVAIHGNDLAICGPQIGVKIYHFHERAG